MSVFYPFGHFPFCVPLAEEWDGTTYYNEPVFNRYSASNSSTEQTEVYGPGTYFPVGMPLEVFAKLFWRTTLLKIQIKGQIVTESGGPSSTTLAEDMTFVAARNLCEFVYEELYEDGDGETLDSPEITTFIDVEDDIVFGESSLVCPSSSTKVVYDGSTFVGRIPHFIGKGFEGRILVNVEDLESLSINSDSVDIIKTPSAYPWASYDPDDLRICEYTGTVTESGPSPRDRPIDGAYAYFVAIKEPDDVTMKRSPRFPVFSAVRDASGLYYPCLEFYFAPPFSHELTSLLAFGSGDTLYTTLDLEIGASTFSIQLYSHTSQNWTKEILKVSTHKWFSWDGTYNESTGDPV
jgi:hypothetical protein